MERFFTAAALVGLLACASAKAQQPRSPEYARVQTALAQGWNTWDTHTVTGEVLLPQGLEIRVGIQQNSTENATAFLPAALIGRRGAGDEEVHPGAHAYDGSYSDLTLTWHGIVLRVEAAHAGPDLVMLVTPLSRPPGMSQAPTAVFSAGFLWNRPGTVARDGARILASFPASFPHANASATANPARQLPIYLAGEDSGDRYIPVLGPYFAAPLNGPVGLSTGHARTLPQVQAVIASQRDALAHKTNNDTSDTANVRQAIETTIAWDTIYEPAGERVITPVSRIWNENWGGYVLFDWDTFFAATLAGLDNRDLAYANVMEILHETSPEGFVPNYARAGGWKSSGWKSNDRSEPPVGAITVLALYRQYGDRWLLTQTFDRLLRWNQWWAAHRVMDGYLVWGSDGANEPQNLDDTSRGTLQGARYESGLDNSPMYDVPHDTGHDADLYDPATHTMRLADVGLAGMYIADCHALAVIAGILGKDAEATQLRTREARFRASLQTLWDPKTGMYLNKNFATGQFSHELSPTNFYPMLAGVPDAAQASEMIEKHLENPQKFGGERVIPSIARDDPAFQDQDYWRGRIWGPMNYLVYLGLRNYDGPVAAQARHDLARKSMAMFLEEWRTKGHVHENYSAVSADSDTVTNSDRFYHWGALLGLIGVEESKGTAP